VRIGLLGAIDSAGVVKALEIDLHLASAVVSTKAVSGLAE
jgi:hypothetical protein